MEIVVAVLCLGVVAALVIGLLIWGLMVGIRRARERYQAKVSALYHWARSQRWSYHAEAPALVHRFQGQPFGRGSSRRALHVLSGVHRGREIVAFEYKFTVSNGDNNSTTYTYLVVATPTPAPRPHLQVGLEGAGSKLLSVFGARDLQLESEEFNRVFRISTGNDRFAYDVLHPRMMEWLLADQRSRLVPFRFEASDLVCWSRTEMNPQQAVWMADYLMDLAERVPAYVWK
ncbi:MAG: hypothetical protein ACRDTM_07685 [Micromonosporaceae bacterium]